MYLVASKPSSGSSKSLVRKTASTFDRSSTVSAQFAEDIRDSAASNSDSQLEASMVSPSKSKKRRESSVSQRTWTVLSSGPRFSTSRPTLSRGVPSDSMSDLGIPAECASSV